MSACRSREFYVHTLVYDKSKKLTNIYYVHTYYIHMNIIPNYCQITILLVVETPFFIGLTYDDPPPSLSQQTGKETLVARQLPTNTCIACTCTCTHTHTTCSDTHIHNHAHTDTHSHILSLTHMHKHTQLHTHSHTPSFCTTTMI